MRKMIKEVRASKTSSQKSDNDMPEYVTIVKSPLPQGIEDLPAASGAGFVTVSVMLPNGTQVTNTEQFQDEDSELIEAD